MNNIIIDRQFFKSDIEDFDSGNCSIIGVHAFAESYNLKRIILRKSIQIIGSGAFKNCKKLESVVIEDDIGINFISNECFKNCYAIKELSMPKQIANIATFAFKHCYSLQSISLTANNICINDNAFADCIQLKTINGSNHIKTIGDFSFSKCKNLQRLDLSNCDSIGNNAFQLCECLEQIILNAKSIPYACFYDCKNLHDLHNKCPIEHIFPFAFYRCKEMKNLQIDERSIVDDFALFETQINKNNLCFYENGITDAESHKKTISISNRNFSVYV